MLLRAGPAAEAASPSGRQATAETAEKLDALMELVFAHLARRCPPIPRPCAPAGHASQRELISWFSRPRHAAP